MVWMIFWFSHFLGVSFRKKNKKNKKNENENGVEDIDGAATSTQPIPKIDEEITINEAIEPDLSLDKLRQDPYSLPAGFHWDTLNLDDPIVVS